MKYISYLPIVVICFIWIIFSYPFFFQGLVPYPSDYQVADFAPWSAYPELFSPVKNASMPDIFGQIYPWRHFTIETWKNFSIPLWNPYSFGGTPHLANYQSAVLQPLNIGFFVFPFVDWWSFLIVLQPLLAGLCTYAYLKSIKVSKAGALISSISFMFCGFMTSWMAYGTLCYAILYVPLAFFSIEKFLSTKQSRYLLLLAITMPLSFFSGHFQMSLYFLIFTIAYILYKFFVRRNVKDILLLIVSLFFGGLITLVQILPSIELYSQSFRSTLFQKIEVIPWGYLVTILSPDFFGNPVTRNAWFGHYAEWNIYSGLLALIFASYALFYFKSSYVRFFLFSTCVVFLLAFQSPLLDLLVFLRIPVLSTSALSRIVVLASFSIAVLAGIGFDVFLNDIKKRSSKKILMLFSVFLLVFVILWVFIFSGSLLTSEQLQIAKSNLRLPTLLYFAFIFLFVVSYSLKKKGILIFIIGVILLLSFDMIRFTNKWMPFEPKKLVFSDVGVTEYMKKIKGYDRAFANFGAEGAVYYNVPILEGYDAVYIRRFGQFAASLDKGDLKDSFRSGVDLPLSGKYLLPAANFLGVKYFIHKISDGQNVWEFPFWEYPSESVKLLFDDGKYQVLHNTNAFPRAYLVNALVVENNPQEIISKLFDESFDLKKTAIIEEGFSDTDLASGSAMILSYSSNSVKVETNSIGNSFLVLADVYYPGWKAKIDGIDAKIFRTNFAFRGVMLSSGKHIVEFYYDPLSFRIGIYSAVLGLLGIGIVVYIFRSKSKR